MIRAALPCPRTAAGWRLEDAWASGIFGMLAGGSFGWLVDALARCLGAFVTDLGTAANRVVVVVVSEFGRRVRENGSGGTDHGEGGCCLLLGGGVLGRRVYGRWPGLRPEAPTPEAGDLAVTTDLRLVLVELLDKRMLTPDLDLVC